MITLDAFPRQCQADDGSEAYLPAGRRDERRRRDGDLPGALVIDRNVLEWRLDPTSPHRIPEAADRGRRIIVVCNEGFSSSLAAATLRRLGLSRATDLAGGYQACRAVLPGPRQPADDTPVRRR